MVLTLSSKRDAQRVSMLWHYQLGHVCQGEIWTDAVLDA